MQDENNPIRLDREDVVNLKNHLTPVMERGNQVLKEFYTGIGLVKDDDTGSMMFITHGLSSTVLLHFWLMAIQSCNRVEEVNSIGAKYQSVPDSELRAIVDGMSLREHLLSRSLIESTECTPKVSSLLLDFLDCGVEEHLATDKKSRSVVLIMTDIPESEFEGVCSKLDILVTAINILKMFNAGVASTQEDKTE